MQTTEQTKPAEAQSFLTDELERLRRENEMCWKMIKGAQNASDEVGLIGMVGSPAWIGQIKKLRSNVNITGTP